ncbi:MAG: DUF2927 domain-containing protein [Pseudomonadota bacterium]
MLRIKRSKLLAFFLAGAFALASCDVPSQVAPSAKPQARPSGLVPPRAAPKGPSASSLALTKYYKRLENDQLTLGLLRTGGGGPDTPFTESDLKRNFVRIAFFDEYQRDQGLLPSQSGPNTLKKWLVPIRVGIEFGANVPAETHARDTADVKKYVSRLARITGHPITVTNNNPNFVVMFMSNDDAAQARQIALEKIPSIAKSNLVFFNNLPRSLECFVVAAGFENEYEWRTAVALIRSELADLQRLSCIHEELAQGLGLANDSPNARPSIFNDDDEFALLTTHDEELLRLLYNPALRAGMSLDEARPIISRILSARFGPS